MVCLLYYFIPSLEKVGTTLKLQCIHNATFSSFSLFLCVLALSFVVFLG